MATQSNNQNGMNFSTVVQVVAAVLVIIGFIFSIANWSQIEQFFWRQRIVGTWQDQTGISITFDGNGNFTSGGGLLPANGFYTFSDSNHLVLQTSGLLSIIGNQIFEIEFSGNTMTWKNQSFGDITTYTKLR